MPQRIALGAFYRRLCARMDKPKANTATAHKLARMVYFMLTRGEAVVDQGPQRFAVLIAQSGWHNLAGSGPAARGKYPRF